MLSSIIHPTVGIFSEHRGRKATVVENPCKDLVSHVQPLHAWSQEQSKTRLCNAQHCWQLHIPKDPHGQGVRFPPCRGHMYVRGDLSCVPKVRSRAYLSSDKA